MWTNLSAVDFYIVLKYIFMKFSNTQHTALLRQDKKEENELMTYKNIEFVIELKFCIHLFYLIKIIYCQYYVMIFFK